MRNKQETHGSQSVRPSFSESLQEVMAQVEFDCLENRDELATEYTALCKIITEVMRWDPSAITRINGMEVAVGDVQEKYAELTAEHLEAVVRKLSRSTEPIRMLKAYLRTALFNIVDEAELEVELLLKKDFGF